MRNMTTFWQVVLRGVVGLSYQGEIAVDDVILTDGMCVNQAENSSDQLGTYLLNNLFYNNLQRYLVDFLGEILW